ncbi:methyltransferase [Petrimonas sulfuriphila]|jgi:tRNA1(Val) A37 N6-methylase TrmN6
MVKDLFYTPTLLAQHLVSFINKRDISTIADFCVGGGELLIAAKKRWPDADFFGCDISRSAINLLRKRYPDWMFSKCNFLNPKSRDSSTILKKKYDLILLNPPFTCKGATIETISFEGTQYQMSTSMAFFVEAIPYLKNDGIMYAILPQSIAYSKKDERIRLYLKERYNFRILEERNNQEFEKCAPNIVLASINDRNIFPVHDTVKKINIGIKDLQIQRGNISMHEIKATDETSIDLIHSTNLKDNRIVNLKHKVDPIRSRIEGPALLIHRVGQPNINKLCVINENEVYALSDCIIAIKAQTYEECNLLKKIILKNWEDFFNLYKGTGAKYITVERLRNFLNP